MAPPHPASTLEPAGELKFGQVHIANLRVLRLDADALGNEMRERVERAPGMFEQAAVIVDFGSLSNTPEPDQAEAVMQALRDAGTLPVGIAFGSDATGQLARRLNLPLLAKFRARYESNDTAPVAQNTRPQSTPAPASAAVEQAPARQAAGSSLLQSTPVRSGQQVYAAGSDLTVTATVGAGAEVIADGHIHIYGALRGRALAGASGDRSARIFCSAFYAELVAVAGEYRVLESIDPALKGKPAQIWLDGETLRIEAMGAA